MRKLEKANLDINFFNKCKDINIFPKYLKWSNVKYKLLHIKINLYQRNLNNAIKEKNNDIRNLSADYDTNQTRLKETTTLIRHKILD